MIKLFSNNHTRTEFIQLSTKNCKACWKCIANCHKNVIGKVDFLGHRHARIDNAERCTGCLKCVTNCEFNAYSIREN